MVDPNAVKCVKCDGKGEVRVTAKRLPARWQFGGRDPEMMPYWKSCPDCHGIGWVAPQEKPE